METQTTRARVRRFFTTVYAKPSPAPPWKRRPPFHLGWWFDVLLLGACAIAAVGFLLS